MHPIIFEYGPLTLRWYGVFVALGFFAAFKLFLKRAKALHLSENESSNLMFLLFLSGIAGARIYYVLWNWNTPGEGGLSFSENPKEMLMVHHGGLVFFGGFILAFITLIFWARWKKRPFLQMADALAPSLALGHAFGRLGCFMNGCCYGLPCHHFWAVRPDSPPAVAGMPIHPTQIYEFLGLIDIVFTLLVLERRQRYQGQLTFSYAILYSVLRFVVEYFRGDVPHTVFGKFTLAQIVCMILFVLAWIGSSRLSFLALKKNRSLKKAISPG